MTTPVIDAHHHLWRIEPGRARWPTPADGQLYRDYGWTELQPQLDDAGVQFTVLVQTEDSDRDTDYLLAQAASSARIAGVVGWVPLHSAELAARRLDELSECDSFVGVRCLVHRMGDDDWLARPDVDRGLDLLERRGVPFDVVTDRPGQLRHVAAIAARHPTLPLVIDHLSKPPIGREDRAAWDAELASAAEHPNVYAKLSGLYPAVGDPTAWDEETLRPYVDRALDLFGPRRLMLGSDWPVCVIAGGYHRVWQALCSLVNGLDATERAAVLGGTATDFYRLTT